MLPKQHKPLRVKLPKGFSPCEYDLEFKKGETFLIVHLIDLSYQKIIIELLKKYDKPKK